MTSSNGHYYVPEKSPWPIITMFGVLFLVIGAVLAINSVGVGSWLMVLGFALFGLILYGWFRDVISENLAGVYNAQVDRSFRQGMFWFIAS
ncbi:MAG: cytochrome c oxidase subunit 3, partial [Lysobacterales bacterium]